MTTWLWTFAISCSLSKNSWLSIGGKNPGDDIPEKEPLFGACAPGLKEKKIEMLFKTSSSMILLFYYLAPCKTTLSWCHNACTSLLGTRQVFSLSHTPFFCHRSGTLVQQVNLSLFLKSERACSIMTSWQRCLQGGKVIKKQSHTTVFLTIHLTNWKLRLHFFCLDEKSNWFAVLC